MSVYRNFHLGPFAEYLVRPDQITEAFDELVEGKLRHNSGMSRPPEITVGGVVHHRYCFMPGEARPGEPVREFSSDDMVYGIQDLRGIDVQAEIDWFAGAFRPELSTLTQYLGRGPTFHWGVVGWLS